jgi:hypothetical protein
LIFAGAIYSCELKELIKIIDLKGVVKMTNRDGADIQEARKYVTSKQSNISSASNSMSNSSSSNASSGMSNLSSSTVSSSRPMEATIQEAVQYNQQHGGSSSFSSSASAGNTGSFDLSSGVIQKEVKDARKATTNPSSGNMQ